MAQMSFEDFISDGYTFPDTGGSLVITIGSNFDYYSFEISGISRSNIVSFSATEDGNEVEVVETKPGVDYVVSLNAAGEYVEITIEVSESPSVTYDSQAFWIYYATSEDYFETYIGQDGYTPPAPPWGDGQHKIYRSGQQVMKMYRNGEMIYWHLSTNVPKPQVTPKLYYDGSPVEGDITTPATVMVAETDTYVLFDVVVEDNTPWAIGYGFSKIAMGTGSTTGVQAMVLPTNPEFTTTTFGLMYKKDGDGDDSMSWTGFSSVFRFKLE